MELKVFDLNFNYLGIIDTYFSAVFQRNYNKASTCSIHASDDYLPLLQKGRILANSSNLKEAYMIDSLELSEDQGNLIVAQGYSLNRLLRKRILWGLQSKSGSIEEVMKHFVDINCINPANSRRKIPGLTLAPNKGLSLQANEARSFLELDEFLFEVGNKVEVSHKIDLDYANKKLVFDVWAGVNRSFSQSVNSRVIFSTEYENVVKQQYTDSDNNYCNMALVAGEGEDVDRKLATVNDSLAGWERNELYVDAKDLNSTIDDSVLSESAYTALLLERGKSKLSETVSVQTFESEVILNNNFIYRVDFDLGDIVTIVNERWGITLDTRISTIEEVYENNSLKVKMNFGNNIPTIIDKLKRKMG